MANELKDYEVLEISFVDAGANLEEKYLALKRKKEEVNGMAKKSLAEEIKKNNEEKKQEEVKPGAKTEEPKVEDKTEEKPAEEIKEEPKAEEVKVEPKVEEPKEEKVDVEKVLKEKEAILKELNDYKAKEKEAIYKSKAMELKNLNSDDIKLHEILKEADEKMSEEVKKNLNALLNKVNAVVEKSVMFKELGKTTKEDANSFAEVEAIAKSRATSEGISYEKAYTEEILKRKDLYEKEAK